MSYLDDRPRHKTLVSAIPLISVRVTPGCVQCGSRLEKDGRGVYDHSGKCANCMGFVTDGDDIFDDLED